MIVNRLILSFLFFVLITSTIFGQDSGTFSGAFETNANVFLRDSAIGAINTPQYDHQIFGGEAWLNINYVKNDFAAGVRFDMYNNSNLRIPTGSYSDMGIGRWFIKKSLAKLDLSAGYLYDQIGSGFIFRAFETRPLFIDNALYGISGKYHFSDTWSATAFVGRQKNAFEVFTGNIKGVKLEGFLSFGEESPLTLAPGLGFVDRTISDENMVEIVNSLRGYLEVDRFSPKYNAIATTIYNTLSYKGINWYSEFAYKANDVYYNPFALKAELVGEPIQGKYENEDGSIFYNSISFVTGNLGLTGEFKRTKNFSFRIDPNQRLLRGLLNYLTPLNRQNTYRLTARYNPAAQEISELAYALDVKYKLNKKLNINVNYSNIENLDGDQLFQEIFTEIQYKHSRKWQITSGVQALRYNQEIYESKANVDVVQSITPFVDFLYKFTPKRALRVETQYMHTEQDYGSWLFGLAEFSMAPHWIFEASAMYNVSPKKPNAYNEIKKTLYPTLGVVYNQNGQRYSLRYVKQVEGVVCSGGICRLEPAFSGVRFSMTTTF
ncbi:MAG: DUF6029 family protein [Saprospiraceae bacterium]